ncbi:LPXTG cell wall anchor domain-containing protein, partial [Lactococcus petauri]
NQTAEKHQVDVHVAPSQEVIVDESKKVEDVQQPQFEKANPVITEKKKSTKTDVQTTRTSKSNSPAMPAGNHLEKGKKQSGNTLPKTGDDNGLTSVLSGFVLLILSFVAFSIRRNRQA